MNMIFYILGSTTASHSNSNTVDSNGYRSDSSLLNGGRGGESSVYNNGGAIQNFANSQVEGKNAQTSWAWKRSWDENKFWLRGLSEYKQF